jgi:hypothetical protein
MCKKKLVLLEIYLENGGGQSGGSVFAGYAVESSSLVF